MRRTRSKSSSDHFTPAACAIASQCSTPLVEPPVAMITATAFSIELRVTMSRGLRFFFTASTSTSMLFAALSRFSSSSAAIVEEPGSDMPTASTDEDMVFAVNIPPHAPTPGSAFLSMHSKSSFDIFPAVKEPTDSNTETICRSLPLWLPGLMVPP